MTILPISAVVPTRNRPGPLQRTLQSLLAQAAVPAEVRVIDASDDDRTREVISNYSAAITGDCKFVWMRSKTPGAAAQRNEATTRPTQPLVCFFDDDILFEPECIFRLWQALEQDATLGGVNAMIANQRYLTPGLISRSIFTILNGKGEKTFAGKLLGPAVNLLPEDSDEFPEVVPVEWLNLGCTIYRRDAMPSPPFDSVFTGYSMMEDITLSLRVAQRGWKLANVRKARIYHDSQPGEHKSNVRALSCMELTNRHHVMTAVMGKRAFADYARLIVWELFSLASSVTGKENRRRLPAAVAGKWDGVCQILSTKRAA